MTKDQELQFTDSGLEQQRILLTLQSGDVDQAVGFVTPCGHYAAHRPTHINDDPVDGEYGWAVTHTTSGILIWKMREVKEAIEVAKYLSRSKILPPGVSREQLMHWHRSPVGAKAAELLAEKLQALAPKWDNRYGFDPSR